jgi:hypothetical protein
MIKLMLLDDSHVDWLLCCILIVIVEISLCQFHRDVCGDLNCDHLMDMCSSCFSGCFTFK